MSTKGTASGMSIGEVAKRFGLTVRALHHYDRLGIVVASERTAAGHRRYSESDLRQLYRVLALRKLGLALESIQVTLTAATEANLVPLLRRHLDAVDKEIRRNRLLRDRLARTLEVLGQTGGTRTADLIGILEVMSMYEGHLSPEQFTKLEREQGSLGFVGIDEWRTSAEAALSELSEAYAAGDDPASPKVQLLVQRIRGLKRQLVGTDPKVSQALQGVHDDGVWDHLRAIVPRDPTLRAYWREAKTAADS